MKKLVAIIVGGTGQFGIITSNLLLKKNYKVVVTTRNIKKKKLFNKNNIVIIHREKNNEDELIKVLKISLQKNYGRSTIIFGSF